MNKVIVYEKIYGRPFIVSGSEVDPNIHVTSIFEIISPDVNMIRDELERLERNVGNDEWYKLFIRPYRDLHQKFYRIIERICENKSVDRKKKRRKK